MRTDDYPARRSPYKEGAGRLAASLVLALAAATASCTHTRDCIDKVPKQLQPDVVTYVIDRRLVERRKVPRRDLEAAMDWGTAAEELTLEREQEIVRYALAYSQCLNERYRTD